VLKHPLQRGLIDAQAQLGDNLAQFRFETRRRLAQGGVPPGVDSRWRRLPG